MKKDPRESIIAILIMLSAVGLMSGQATAPASFPNVKIGNFGQMDAKIYRGAQPEREDFKSLLDLGVRTVVNLRNDPEPYEKEVVESLGMRYVNIPMSGWRTPRDTDVQAFLQIANDPKSGKIFVHCKAGKHRTGVVGAVYRFTKYGWSYDQAYQEMKNYNFSSGLVHGKLKSYVKNYANRTGRASPQSRNEKGDE